MTRSLRRELRRGNRTVLWSVGLPGTEELGYFVEGLGTRKLDSNSFSGRADAETWFAALEAKEPLHRP